MSDEIGGGGGKAEPVVEMVTDCIGNERPKALEDFVAAKAVKLKDSACYGLRLKEDRRVWIARVHPTSEETSDPANAHLCSGAWLNRTCWSWDLRYEAVPKSELDSLRVKDQKEAQEQSKEPEPEPEDPRKGIGPTWKPKPPRKGSVDEIKSPPPKPKPKAKAKTKPKAKPAKAKAKSKKGGRR